MLVCQFVAKTIARSWNHLYSCTGKKMAAVAFFPCQDDCRYDKHSALICHEISFFVSGGFKLDWKRLIFCLCNDSACRTPFVTSYHLLRNRSLSNLFPPEGRPVSSVTLGALRVCTWAFQHRLEMERGEAIELFIVDVFLWVIVPCFSVLRRW